ncbi:hypothetical protein BSL78_21331 [Apostichopus japonicus]|uniref:Death domain-containing protein n=1 Tax=Stichopus japonicus TaxID=307972 RepID=A0A2G8K1D5_STIJA|nr:hypothetical protein BSL78_21331 [Apostichopus japonicus]
MPQPNLDSVKFVVHQRDSDKTEIVANIVREDGCDDLNKYMEEAGYNPCEEIRGAAFKAMTGENFFIRLVGDLKVDTFGDKSYRKDRLELKYLRNRTNRKDFVVRGVYHGRFQSEYAGKVLLHRMTLQAGTLNKGSGRHYTLNNLESVIGNVTSSSKLVVPKEREDPAPQEIHDSFEETELIKDVVLRTISKDIPKNFVVPLAMHLFGLTETEVLNLSLLPHHRDFDEQRYAILEKWKLKKGQDATFSKLIEAFLAVKMKSAAASLNRNLLTDQYLKKVGKALPGDLKPFADILAINLEEVQTKFDAEMTEHKYQVLWRWREDTHQRLKRRATHIRLLKALRYSGMEAVAEKHTEISSVDARDEYGQDFNKRIFFLNTLVKWRNMTDADLRATFENLIAVMKSNQLGTTASIMNEMLLSDKRLKTLAPQISDELIHDLADELRFDTTTMMIPRGGADSHLGYRLLLRWKETRGKYASHTELMKALGKAGLDNLAKDVDQMGSVSVVKGAMSDFCIRYVSSWIHTSRAHEWPSLVQNIPSDLVTGMDARTVQQIKRSVRDPRDKWQTLSFSVERGKSSLLLALFVIV